jgi:DNA-binding CsgD family transcriptional regulator
MTRDGMSAKAIGAELGINQRTVVRIRTAIGVRGTNQGSADTYIDEVAVQRAMDGDRTGISPAETTEAVQRLTKQGRSATWIAVRLGISKRTVTRHRMKNRKAAA